MSHLAEKNVYLLVEVKKMFYCTAPFTGLLFLLILSKIHDFFQNRKIKKFEEEMRARGMDENSIFFFTRAMKL